MFKVVLLSFLFTFSAFSKTEIKMFTYHPDPPYVVNKKERSGYTFELANFLNDQLDSNYRFSVVVLPRKRLNQLLLTENNIVVPWTTPKWFNDSNKRKFKWSKPLLTVSDVLISNVNKPIKSNNVKGLKLAGLRGGKWPKFDHLIESGTLEKVNVSKYYSIIQMIERGYVDGGIIPSLTVKYYQNAGKVGKEIFIPTTPLSTNHLQVLIKGEVKLKKFLDKKIIQFKETKTFKLMK